MVMGVIYKYSCLLYRLPLMRRPSSISGEGGDSDKEEFHWHWYSVSMSASETLPCSESCLLLSSGFQDIRLPQTKNLYSSCDESQHYEWTYKSTLMIMCTHVYLSCSYLPQTASLFPGQEKGGFTWHDYEWGKLQDSSLVWIASLLTNWVSSPHQW